MIETVRISDTGKILVHPTLEMIVFLEGRRDKYRDGLLTFRKSYTDYLDDSLRWYKTNVMKSCKRIVGDSLKQLESMLVDDANVNGYLLGLFQHAGEQPDDYVLPAFEYFSEQEQEDKDDPVCDSFVRICLPVDACRNAEAFVECLQSALAKLDFRSGYCGYSYYWNTTDHMIERQVASRNRGWLNRFPGLAYGKPMALFNYSAEGILAVSWLTIIGKTLFQMHPQVYHSILKSDFRDINIIAIDNDRGVLIRAGEQPRLGDTNIGDALHLYKRVGSLLSEMQISDEALENLSVLGLPDDEPVSWYRRFFAELE